MQAPKLSGFAVSRPPLVADLAPPFLLALLLALTPVLRLMGEALDPSSGSCGGSVDDAAISPLIRDADEPASWPLIQRFRILAQKCLDACIITSRVIAHSE